MVSVQYLKYFMKICQTRSMNKEAEGEKLLKHTRLILGQFALLENLHEDSREVQSVVSISISMSDSVKCFDFIQKRCGVRKKPC